MTCMQSRSTISYELGVFLKYKNKICTLAKCNHSSIDNLTKFFKPDDRSNVVNISHYENELNFIISSILQGNNTNDVMFKNDIKYLLNIMTSVNFNETLDKLKLVDFSDQNRVIFFIYEIITNAVNCPSSVKGEIFQETTSISHLYVQILNYFSKFHNFKNSKICFNDELKNMCMIFFMDFVSLQKVMDNNNYYTVCNYKGFMSVLGLLLCYDLITFNIIIDCVDSIKRTIFCAKIESLHVVNESNKMFGYKKSLAPEHSNHFVYFDTPNIFDSNIHTCYRSLDECLNYHKGYIFLMALVIQYVIKNDKIYDNLLLNILLRSHLEFISYNEIYKTINSGKITNPLKHYNIMSHNEIGLKLQNLINDKIKNNNQ